MLVYTKSPAILGVFAEGGDSYGTATGVAASNDHVPADSKSPTCKRQATVAKTAAGKTAVASGKQRRGVPRGPHQIRVRLVMIA